MAKTATSSLRMAAGRKVCVQDTSFTSIKGEREKKPNGTKYNRPRVYAAQIETDKSVMDFEAQDDGFMAKILVGGGSTDVPIGTIIGITVEDEDDVGSFEDCES